MYKTCKYWDKLPINWCRISAINSSDKCCYSREASPRCESSQSCFRKHCRSTNRPLLIMWSYRGLWLNPFPGFLPLTYMQIHLMFVFRLLLYESQIQCLCLCKYVDRCAQRYVYNSCILKELDRDISHHLSTHDVSPCHGISAFAIKRLFF